MLSRVRLCRKSKRGDVYGDVTKQELRDAMVRRFRNTLSFRVFVDTPLMDL
jgi:hypothetical protein